eukprot:COSAG06_NODE_3604_length_5131_cov_1.935612_5_plen_105_part_00
MGLVILRHHNLADRCHDIRMLIGDIMQLSLVNLHVVEEKCSVVVLWQTARCLGADCHARPVAHTNILTKGLRECSSGKHLMITVKTGLLLFEFSLVCPEPVLVK